MALFKKTMLASTLAATALACASPALAQERYQDRDNSAAVAVGAGIIGLALGAIIASDNEHDRYYDAGYTSYASSPRAPTYVHGWQLRDGYYWDGDGHRHSLNEYARYQHSPKPKRQARGHGHESHDGSRNDQGRGHASPSRHAQGQGEPSRGF